MTARAPLIVIHRRNRIDQLQGLPKDCWVEIDVEIYENKAYLTHDPVCGKHQQPWPDLLEEFLPLALESGVGGFVVDCKRECAEKWVKPVFEKNGVTNYFYLNEMEVQADIFQSLDPLHNSGIRVWKYRGASDIIRFAEDMKASGSVYPKWIWVDCWQRGLIEDITKAHLPIKGDDARQLQKLDIKLCICSPELYVHKYDTKYDEKTLSGFYQGMRAYREKMEAEGIRPNAICTKFPEIWLESPSALQTFLDHKGDVSTAW